MEISLTNQFRNDLPPFLQPIFPYQLVMGFFLHGSDGYISLVAHESFHAYQGTLVPERLAAAETAVSRTESNYRSIIGHQINPFVQDALARILFSALYT